MGGYVAGRLTEAGHAVTLFCRGRTYEIVRRRGIALEDPLGLRRIRPAVITDDPSTLWSAPGPELLMLCVKSWQVSKVSISLLPYVGDNTVAVTIQNGVTASETAAAILGAGRVLAGAFMLIAEQTQPGVYRRSDGPFAVELGPSKAEDPVPEFKAQRVVRLLREIGFATTLSADIHPILWRKLAFAASIGGVSALHRLPPGDARTRPDIDSQIRAGICEAIEIAKAEGVRVDESDVARIIGEYEKLPAGMTSSMYRDIEAGRPSELLELSGEIVIRALSNGIPAPIHSAIIDQLVDKEKYARELRRSSKEALFNNAPSV